MLYNWFKILIHLFPQHFAFYRSLEKTPKCRKVSENTDSTGSLIFKSCSASDGLVSPRSAVSSIIQFGMGIVCSLISFGSKKPVYDRKMSVTIDTTVFRWII